MISLNLAKSGRPTPPVIEAGGNSVSGMSAIGARGKSTPAKPRVVNADHSLRIATRQTLRGGVPLERFLRLGIGQSHHQGTDDISQLQLKLGRSRAIDREGSTRSPSNSLSGTSIAPAGLVTVLGSRKARRRWG